MRLMPDHRKSPRHGVAIARNIARTSQESTEAISQESTMDGALRPPVRPEHGRGGQIKTLRNNFEIRPSARAGGLERENALGYEFMAEL